MRTFHSALFAASLLLWDSSCGDSGTSNGTQYRSPRESTDFNSHQAVGASAHELLAADKYQSVVIELQAMQGFAPTAQTRTALQSFIAARVNKPGGVTIVMDADIPAQGKSAYSLNDVGQLEAANRQSYST